MLRWTGWSRAPALPSAPAQGWAREVKPKPHPKDAEKDDIYHEVFPRKGFGALFLLTSSRLKTRACRVPQTLVCRTAGGHLGAVSSSVPYCGQWASRGRPRRLWGMNGANLAETLGALGRGTQGACGRTGQGSSHCWFGVCGFPICFMSVRVWLWRFAHLLTHVSNVGQVTYLSSNSQCETCSQSDPGDCSEHRRCSAVNVWCVVTQAPGHTAAHKDAWEAGRGARRGRCPLHPARSRLGFTLKLSYDLMGMW